MHIAQRYRLLYMRYLLLGVGGEFSIRGKGCPKTVPGLKKNCKEVILGFLLQGYQALGKFLPWFWGSGQFRQAWYPRV